MEQLGGDGQVAFAGETLGDVADVGVDAERFLDLGARPVTVSGNLKVDTPPLPVDEDVLAKLKKQIGKRPTWAAVSGETPEALKNVEVRIGQKTMTLAVASSTLNEQRAARVSSASGAVPASLIKALADLSREIDKKQSQDGGAKEVLAARVKSLMVDVPDLPNFSRFHDAFRDDPKSKTSEGHMRAAYYMAYDAASCEYIKLNDKQIDERLKSGPELVSSKFVIPYPPGFPIMVPGQVITAETIAFMRKLDVKEIHGFNAGKGLELLKPDALAAHKSKASQR